MSIGRGDRCRVEQQVRGRFETGNDANGYRIYHCLSRFRRYSQDPHLDAAFAMAQPAGRAWNQPQKRLAFCEYLTPANPALSSCTFQPRSRFGDFIAKTYSDAREKFQNPENPVSLEYICSRVESISPTPSNRLRLAFNSNSAMEADSTIVATGHSFRNEFAAFQTSSPSYTSTSRHRKHSNSGFFQFPFDMDQARSFLNQCASTEPLCIIGAGPAFIDTLDFLSRTNCKSPLVCISNSFPLFWPYHPSGLVHQKNGLVDFEIATLENLAAEGESTPNNPHTENMLLEGLPFSSVRINSLINTELAEHENLGKMNLLEQLLSLKTEVFLSFGKLTAQKFEEDILNLMSWGISPPRYKLLKNLESTHRLQYIQGTLKPEHIIEEHNQFKLHVPEAPELKSVAAIFNASSMARAPIEDSGRAIHPLLQQLQQQNLIRLNPEHPSYFQAGFQGSHGLFIASGANTERRWILERFTSVNAEIANQIVNCL